MKILLAPLRANMFDFSGIIARFPFIKFEFTESREEALRKIADSDALFGHLDEEQYRAGTKLKWVQSQGSGVDWMFRVPGFGDSDIVVTNTRGAQSDTIAEHAVGLMISMTRGFYGMFLDHRAHTWRRPLVKPAVALYGMTVGIIGLGQIGLAIAERAKAFHMKVMGSDAEMRGPYADVERFFAVDEYHEMVSRSNVIIVTVPLTDKTKNMMGAREFGMMQPGGYIVAVSRGGVVNESDLMDALKSGMLAGAALDVQVQKPVPPESPLWDTPNLILTPHCAGESTLTVEKTLGIFEENIRRFAAGERL
ncbi:MAG: D-2-hydroxyacid dehydrogenase, partial [Spirochaetes bacterium]|nr:D-2-hydroxyacid dehydrogenase [Spirochaetota bacterium]